MFSTSDSALTHHNLLTCNIIMIATQVKILLVGLSLNQFHRLKIKLLVVNFYFKIDTIFRDENVSIGFAQSIVIRYPQIFVVINFTLKSQPQEYTPPKATTELTDRLSREWFKPPVARPC